MKTLNIILSIIFSVVFAIILFYVTFVSIACVVNASPKTISSITCTIDALIVLVIYRILDI